MEEKHHKDTRREFRKTRKPLKSTMGAYENPPLNFFPGNLFPNLLAVSASINSFLIRKWTLVGAQTAQSVTKSHILVLTVGRCRDWVPITFEVITSVWRRFRHRDLGGSIRLDALHVIVLFVRPYAAYKGQERSAPVRLRQWCSAPASARASASAPHRLRRTRPAAPPSPVAAPGGGPRE